jgi:hypothetical protein
MSDEEEDVGANLLFVSEDASRQDIAGTGGSGTETESGAGVTRKRKEQPRKEQPTALSDSWITTRFNQVCMHLKKLARDRPGSGVGLISEDEMKDATCALDAALSSVKADPEEAKKLETGSAVFWAIVLARDVATRRAGGWYVDTDAAVKAWDADMLHGWLSHYKR